MFNWLYNFSDVGIGLLFGLLGGALLASMPLLRGKLLRIHVPVEYSAAARDALGVVTGFTGIVLAFLLVQSQGNLRNLEMRVGAEAHDLAQLDRWLLWYGDPGDSALRTSLRKYGESIVSDEWLELRKGAPSTRTGALFFRLSHGIRDMEPAPGIESLIFTEMLKKADELAEDRSERIVAAASLKLPSAFWDTIVAMLLILVLLATLVEATFARALALGGQGTALALLVALVFIFDHPFKGQTAVSPRPIIEVLKQMRAETSN